ncbi:hypothetical protein ARMGADRAFT_773099 [Armillaria gallica]|uniref:Uncharacterized protein n=1 Tax=Armillaria gallica TaxID=47427 RepID=A0A2H3CY66_ARMGA|nr:hypothetical protein ARMGADRAFT_773099 [Armillaria gallica]
MPEDAHPLDCPKVTANFPDSRSGQEERESHSNDRRKGGFQGLRLEAPLHSGEWVTCSVSVFGAGFLAEAEYLRDIGAVVSLTPILRPTFQGIAFFLFYQPFNQFFFVTLPPLPEIFVMLFSTLQMYSSLSRPAM